ncbi:TadE/TadG family type IV pilus assembly protein [Novosphingobium huizhouense]|uniref:TadE/TadG family type IV pilus assembly protein n=1 Tax=Novosphingobium huizhouense TaxID=2866625 RepID=UPI001CD86063|nr:TadE/TadG family type IV pilus assembly protein [Novosphingobium huizhouense]
MKRQVRPALARLAIGLGRDRSGAALIEFAIALPVLISFGMFATEVANITMVDMQLSEIALAVADNASRLGQADNSSVTPTIAETDVDSVMKGASEAGKSITLSTNGRVILSSLEKDTTTGKQFIRWQRCSGSLVATSAFGNDTTANGLNGPAIAGVNMGQATLTADTGSAVMVAEVYYRYTGLFGSFFFAPFTMRQQAAFLIRDQRNLAVGLTGTGGTSKCT